MTKKDRNLRHEMIKLSEAKLNVEMAIAGYVESLADDEFVLNSANVAVLNRLYDLRANMATQHEELLEQRKRKAMNEKLREEYADEQAAHILQKLRHRDKRKELGQTVTKG